VIQYTTLFSTWYQNRSSELPLFFFLFFQHLPNSFPAPPFASAKPHRSIFFSSSSSGPHHELVTTPLKTLDDNRAKAAEITFIGATTRCLKIMPPEEPAGATCRS
jgi:hypothetical protein